jgi:glutaredoxin-like protein NrdH
MYERELKERRPILLALSTCPRCQRMKSYLSQQGIDVIAVDVDLLPFEEKRDHLEFVRMVNPRVSFPTLVVGDLAVIGEDYDGVREALNQ